MQRRQVVALGNDFFRRGTDSLGREVLKLVQPQFFGEIFRLSVVAKGAVILVVIINLKQRKGLIDSINQLRVSRCRFRTPSCGRRVRR